MDARLAIDSTVLLLYFVLIIAVGLYMGRKEENLKDFALGGRRMPRWAVLASLIAAVRVTNEDGSPPRING
jgi:SSS family solute:Na+ symporter